MSETHTFLPTGKLPSELLAELISTLPISDPDLYLGPGVGEDAAVIEVGRVSGEEGASSRREPSLSQQGSGDSLLAAKSDPITFATDEIGYYAVNVCANDLAVCGARPRFYLPTVLLPVGATEEEVREICDQLGAACRALDIVVAGGHTEVTAAVNQPVVAGTLLGEVARAKVVRTGGCRPGDVVLLAGSAGIEGTSIIAREMGEVLLEQGWSEAEVDEAGHYLYEPGISVLGPALAAAESGLVTAMHDPTEGGVATGLWELADASSCGLEVELGTVPVTRLTAAACAVFGLDPLGTIASGGLLATAAADDVDAVLGLWRGMGREGRVIGRVLPAGAGVYGLREGRRVDLPRFSADEIVKLWW
ncbi:MAG: AIR synthase-related protein [Caldilineaceae bacterium]|nr:AIR synthase-related protein [Caldilineaceae bacterium]